MDRFLHAIAKIAVYLGCLPKADIRHVYVWKATAVAHAHLTGKPKLTEKMINDWRFWELRYARAGYRPFSIVFLTIAVARSETLHPKEWHQLRLPGERVTLHATRFRQDFLEGHSS